MSSWSSDIDICNPDIKIQSTNNDISTGFMRVDKVTAGNCMLLLANACFNHMQII